MNLPELQLAERATRMLRLFKGGSRRSRKKSQAEAARWDKEKLKVEAAVAGVRDQT